MTGTVCDSPKPRRWSHQILAAEPGRDRDPLDPCPLGHQAALSRHPSRAPCSEQGWLVSWGLSRIGHRTPGATSASITNPPRDQEPVRPCPQASVSPAEKWEVGLSGFQNSLAETRRPGLQSTGKECVPSGFRGGTRQAAREPCQARPRSPASQLCGLGRVLLSRLSFPSVKRGCSRTLGCV